MYKLYKQNYDINVKITLIAIKTFNIRFAFKSTNSIFKAKYISS